MLSQPLWAVAPHVRQASSSQGAASLTRRLCLQEDLLALRQRWRVLLAPQKERTASSAALLQATQEQARLV